MAASDTKQAEAQADSGAGTAGDARAGEQFVEKFREAWAAPSPERLNALLHPEGRLRQPLEEDVVGLEQAEAMWKRLFSFVPDLRMEVLSWAAHGSTVFIEARAIATFAGKPLEWQFVDRIELEDGLVKERIAYFDSLPLAGKLLSHPAGWPGWVRANASRFRRR